VQRRFLEEVMPLDPKRVQKLVRELRKFLKKVPKRPSIEDIHDLRTNTRRFETNVEALGLSSKRNERRVLRLLARLRRRAGKIRDMDVLTGYGLSLHVNGEQDCLVQLLGHLGANRSKYVKKLRAANAKYGSELRRRLKRTAAKFDKLLQQTAGDSVGTPNVAASEAMARAVQLSSELKNPPRLGKNNLHPFRLKVKELLYVLQLGERAEQQRFVDKLGEVKDAIGEWHDWEELIAIATDVLDHGAQCKLLQQLRKISNRKYEHALAVANDMRKTIHRAASSAGRGSSKGPTLVQPALAAASAIAS
jgi:CHAD domain-containing protein